MKNWENLYIEIIPSTEICDWVEVMLLKRKKERNMIPEGMAFTLRMSSGQRTEWGGGS